MGYQIFLGMGLHPRASGTQELFYYANYESNDVLNCATEMVNTESRVSLQILEQCSPNLAACPVLMNDLPVIGYPCLRKELWDRQGANSASR